MRIAVAHDSVGTAGGVETYLVAAIQALRHRGHQVALVYYRRAERPTSLRNAAQVALGIEERGIDAVLNELADWRPDVIFTHNMSQVGVDRRFVERWPVRATSITRPSSPSARWNRSSPWMR